MLFAIIAGLSVTAFLIAIRQILKLKQNLQNRECTNLELTSDVKKLQKEVNELQEKKLITENELRVKTKELIIKTRENDDKLQLIESIRKKISEAIGNPPKTNIKLHEIDLELDNFNGAGDPTFEMQLSEYNREFMQLIKEKFPFITPHDQRICLYIKNGMTSQQIAGIMNVLPSSIYISRSRLRKKLGLENDQDLFDFLGNLK